MLVAPLSHDQPRNAALVQYRGLGLSLGPTTPQPAAIRAAVLSILASAEVRQNAQHFAREFRAESGRQSALRAVDRLIAAGRASA
jgi:UDP:flavonoid glycosyltransferase YjiC (YdhE family)